MADEMANLPTQSPRDSSRSRVSSYSADSRRARPSTSRGQRADADGGAEPPQRTRRAGANAGNPFMNAIHSVGSAAGNAASRIRGARGPQDDGDQDFAPTRYGSDYLGTGEPCHRCGRPVERGQMRCPHCGSMQSPFYTNPYLMAPLVVALVLIVVLTIVFSSCAPSGGTPNSGGTQGGDTGAAASSESIEMLNSMVTTANDQYVTANATSHTYTDESILYVRAALSAAESVASSESPTQKDVEGAISTLRGSLDQLVQRTPYAELTWPYYDDLNANIDTYADAQVAMSGVVLSTEPIAEGNRAYIAISGDTTCIVSLSYGSDIQSNTAVSEGITIDFGGVVTGPTTYTTEDGTQVSVPAVRADEIYTTGTSVDVAQNAADQGVAAEDVAAEDSAA